MISSPLLAAPSVPSSPLQSWLASAPACAAAKAAGCLCLHSAADLRALRHDWHRSALAALAAHTPLAHSASDRCAFRQAAHADPFFLGMSVLNPQHVNVHSSSLFTACLHSSTIATRLSETRRKHAARAVPAAVESNLCLAPHCSSPRLTRLSFLAPPSTPCFAAWSSAKSGCPACWLAVRGPCKATRPSGS